MKESKVFNIDCVEYMKSLPDKAFDLAIVDPPYGIGFGKYNRANRDSDGNTCRANKYKQGEWDEDIPSESFFDELQRVSKNQIIWGGNYFPTLWRFGCKGFIFWYKQNPVNNFADGEMAWTSFNSVAKCFDYRYYGNLQGNSVADIKIHPTQKPVALYEWLLMNYAKEGDRILDTHLGSGSSRIACHKLGFDFVGCEIDKDYFEAQNERFKLETSQKTLF